MKPWYETLFWELVSLLTKQGLPVGAATLATVPPTGYDKDSADESIRRTLVDFAAAQVGEPYRYGAEGPAMDDLDEWDCSELFEHAFNRAGLAYPDGCVNQKAAIGHRRVLEPKAGDVFFYGPNANGIPHTGMYCGDGSVIHADGGKARMVVRRPRYEIEGHPRFEGWFRHTDLAWPQEERA